MVILWWPPTCDSTYSCVCLLGLYILTTYMDIYQDGCWLLGFLRPSNIYGCIKMDIDLWQSMVILGLCVWVFLLFGVVIVLVGVLLLLFFGGRGVYILATYMFISGPVATCDSACSCVCLLFVIFLRPSNIYVHVRMWHLWSYQNRNQLVTMHTMCLVVIWGCFVLATLSSY